MLAKRLALVRFFQSVLSMDQEVMGQETHRHMMMPTQPGANLVMVHAQATFTLFNGCLDSLYAIDKKEGGVHRGELE